MAYAATQSQNMGPRGGIPANFGSNDIETSGTVNGGVVKVAGLSLGAPTAGTSAASTVMVTDSSGNMAFTGRLTTTDGVSSGTARVVGGRAYSATSASDNLLASAGASAHVDHAQTYSIPASTIGLGSIVRIRYHVLVTDASGTDTLETKLYLGSTTLMTTTAFDPDAANDFVIGEFILTGRAAAGAAAAMVGHGQWITSDGGAYVRGAAVLTTTNFATNGALVVKVSSKWSSTTASTNARLESLFVDIT